MQSTVDWIEGSKNPETCELYEWEFGCKFVNRVSENLPSQHELPGLDSILGVVIPRRTKLDILSRLIIRKDFL